MATKPKMSSDITIKEKVVKPGYLNNPSDSGVLTITWAPGTNGSDHKISAYRIYWRNNQGQKPTTSTHAGKVEFKVANLTLKNGKYTATINLSQAGKSDDENQTYSGEFRRGHQIVVGMIAIGGELESDMVYSNSKCYINDLPKSPSNIIFSRKRSDGNPISPITAEKTTHNATRLPYNGGKIAFTGGTPGKDTYTYSNLSIYYSSTPTGAKSKITTSFEKTYNWNAGDEKKEVYFWTYDGLEFSKEPLKFTIEREPELKLINHRGFNGDKVVTTRNDLAGNYVISPRISYSTNKETQLKATLFVSRLDYLTTRQIEEPINGFNYTDIRKHFTNDELENGATYYFKYYFTDGYMDTDLYTSDYFYVAPKPKIQGFRDKLCTPDNYDYIVESGKFFYRDLTFFIEQDSAWPISKIIAKDLKGNKKTYAIDFSNSDQNNLYDNYYSLVSYTFKDLTPNEQYEFSLVSPISNLISNEQNIEFDSQFGSHTYLTKLKEPNLSNVSINTFNPSVFKPYSANNDLEVFVNKFVTENNYFLKEWRFQWSSSPAYTSNEFPNSENSDGLTFYIPAKELSEELINVSTFNKNGINSIMPTIRLYTVYGNYYEIKGPGLAIDFSEPLNFIGNQTFKVTDGNNNNIDYLKEGAQYSFSGEIESYNGAPYVRLLIKYKNKDYVEVFSGHKLKDTVELPKNGEPINYSYKFDSSIEQIIDLSTTATIKIQCSKYSNFENPIEYEFDKTYPAYGHIAPSFLLKSATYDKEKEQIKVDFDNVNLGIDESLYQNSTVQISILLNGAIPDTVVIKENNIWSFINNPTVSFSYGFSESVIFVKLLFTVISAKEPSTSYTTYTQNVSVYNISPTVSYRQNHLSINREYESNNLNDGIIIINDYDKYKKIYLVSQSENKILSIDVQTGALDGFTINGGTWQ